jgi:hypothetical protein
MWITAQALAAALPNDAVLLEGLLGGQREGGAVRALLATVLKKEAAVPGRIDVPLPQPARFDASAGDMSPESLSLQILHCECMVTREKRV